MSKKKSAKRIILVNRDFQLRYAGAAVGVGLITTSLSVFVTLFPLYVFEILRIPRFLPWPILAGMGIALVINVASVFGMGIVITHRIAGPMYSIVRHLRRIGLGFYGYHMRIRDGDDLRYVVRNVNDMIDSLKFLTKQDLYSIDKATKLAEGGDLAALKQELLEFRQRIAERLEHKEEKED